MFTDHNNTLVQESQDPRIAWPFGAGISEGGLNRAVPSVFWNALPSANSFLPPVNPTPAIAFGADPRLKIPYAMEYNFGIQHAITSNLTATVNYVGSGSRHLFIQPMYNAPLPSKMGPGPVAPRTPFPFFGQFPADFNSGRKWRSAYRITLRFLVPTLGLAACPFRMKDSLAAFRTLTTSGRITARATLIFPTFWCSVMPTRCLSARA